MTSPMGFLVPADTIHLASVGLMLAHRLRRWPNIKPTLSECLVLAGISPTYSTWCDPDIRIRILMRFRIRVSL